MKNRHLIKNWRSLAIEFKSSKEIQPLAETFLICVGESQIDVDGTAEKVVGFFQGYDEKGSPAVFFQSDNKDRCWTFAYNSQEETHIRCNIGRFVRVKPPKEKDLTPPTKEI